MVARKDCVAAIRTASGDALSDAEALAVLESVERHRLRLEAAGTIDRLDARLAKLAGEEAERAKIMAALARKHAVLGALARQRTWDAVLARMNTGLSYRDAVLSVLEGTTNHRNSVAATRLAYEARYVGGIMGRIAKERPHLEKRLGNQKLNEDATRLMRGETIADADPDARFLADLLAEYKELARLDSNALGANIGKLDGHVNQAHVDWRLLRVDKEDWVQAILPRLDMDRSFPDGADATHVLRGIYDTITLGRELDAARPEGAFSGPPNFAKALAQHRVLHFRSADDYLAYNQQFGFGNLFTAEISHLQRMARTNAIMDKLGPNPGHTLDALLDGLVTRARTDESLSQKQRAKIIRALEAASSGPERERMGAIGAAYRVVSGYAATPHDWTLAQSASTFRNVQSMAKLGGAVITAVPTDLASLTLNLNYQGKNYWAALGQTFRQSLAGRGKGEAREVSYLLGEGFDGIIGQHMARYGDIDTVPGRMSRLMTHFFRLNGLSGWTDTVRAVGARVMAADMGRLSGKAWDKLPPRYQRVLRVHDIGEAEWDTIRATSWVGENGNRYVTPDRIEDRNLQIALRRFYSDESVAGVIEVEDSTRRLATAGTRPGTLAGEAVRSLLQFKGFPIAFTRRVLGRAVRGTSGQERVVHVAKLIATLTVAGYLSQVAKDATRGLEPKDPTEPETIMQAMLQSGAAGIYGDFLFSSSNRFGNSALETVAGPGVTTLADIVNLYQAGIRDEVTAKEAFDSIWQNIPGQNIWWARTALDLLVLNELREALSPGYLRRRDRFARETYRQERFLPQSVYR